jgi:hypothetical protein
MKAPATKAISAMVQSRGCMFLRKSISLLLYCIIHIIQRPNRGKAGERSLDAPPRSARKERMAKPPSYPDDAPVGPAEAASTPESGADKTADSKRAKHLMTGAAIGIGSAAIVAALLYANYGRKSDKGNG